MKTYHADGSVRGSCGHKHSTIGAAYQCVLRDRNSCAALPGGNSYSDREVCRTDDEALSENEAIELEDQIVW